MPTRVRKSLRSSTSRPAAAAPSGRPAPGRYTDVDSLARDTRRAVRPAGYTEVDRLSRPQAGPVRPGSYVDVNDAPAAGTGRPGSYTDTDLLAA